MLLRLLIFITIVFFINTLSALNFFTPCERCERCKPCKPEKYVKKDENDVVEVVNVDEMSEECANHMNESGSRGFCSGFKYVYNPFKDNMRRKHVLSACLRCAQCLAISEEVKNIFEKIIGNDTHLEPNVAKCKVNRELTEEFCKCTFSSHDLRNYNGRTVFSKIGEGGTHIRTDFDGQWPTMITNMCLLFVRQLDPDSKYAFFHQFWMGFKDTDDYLCRGDGVFRDCKNLLNNSNITYIHNVTSEDEPDTFWPYCFF